MLGHTCSFVVTLPRSGATAVSLSVFSVFLPYYLTPHYCRDIPWPQRREDQRMIIQYSVAVDAAISTFHLFDEMLPYVRQHLPILRRVSPMLDLTFVLESEYFKWLCFAARESRQSDTQDRFRAYSREIEASAHKILRESRSGRMMHDPDETVSLGLSKIGTHRN